MTKPSPDDPTNTSSDHSFNDIYSANIPAVIGYLRSHGVDDPEAVAQDVFVAVLDKFGNIRGGEEGVRTVIFSIAHARTVDHRRRMASRPFSIPYERELDHRTTPSAEQQSDAASQSPVLGALDGLNEDQREVLLLRVVADLPIDRVATIMQKTPGSIKQLQRRALLSLRGMPDVANMRSS